MPIVPPFRRWPYLRLQQRLERPLAPITVVRGPRQIGKTTLQLQLIESLLAGGVPPQRIIRVRFDELPSLSRAKFHEPILRLVEWFETAILDATLNEAARRGEPAFLFLDEVQNLDSWDVQLKFLVDHATARVMVTGSSALRIERGRDSLAGRIRSLEVGPLRLAEISAFQGLGGLTPWQEENNWHEWLEGDFWRDLVGHADRESGGVRRAFRAFSERGGYPMAQAHPDVPWSEIAQQLNETVVRRVIEHDLRVGERGRKRDPQLLEEVFRMACRYIGQSPSFTRLAEEAGRALNSTVGVQRIHHYIDFLDSSLLLRKVERLEMRLRRRRGQSKLCLCDHAIRAAWLQEVVPLDPEALDRSPHLTTLAGHVAESTVGSFLCSLTGLSVAHLPERGGEPEVGFVMTIGDHRIPVEVKYSRTIDPERDTAGLRAFIGKDVNNAPLGLLITRPDAQAAVSLPIVAVPLPALLLVR